MAPFNTIRTTVGNDGLTRDQRIFGDTTNPDTEAGKTHGHYVTVRHPEGMYSTIEYIRHEGASDAVVAHGKPTSK